MPYKKKPEYYKINTDFYDPLIYSLEPTRAFSRIGIEKRKEYKVIYNDPATILFVDGKKYVSKAHDEPFDEEKGLLMCLAKANGISHLELKRMIKNAKRGKQNDKQVQGK